MYYDPNADVLFHTAKASIGGTPMIVLTAHDKGDPNILMNRPFVDLDEDQEADFLKKAISLLASRLEALAG